MRNATRAMTAWATKRRAAAVAATVLLTLAAIGCSETPPPEPIDLVPADANLVANVELGRILLDPDVAGGFESVPMSEDAPASLEDALAEVEAQTGIDLLQFSDIVAFGVVDTTMGPDDQSDFAVMARGTFNGDAILDKVRLESGGELTEDEYRGHALLIGSEADGSETVMTVLADEVFVLGTLGAVTSVIDVLEDGEGALSGPLLDSYVALGDPLVKAAFAVPPGAVDDLGGVPTGALPIPFDPSLLSDIRTVGFAGDKEADLVTITLTLEYASTASAEDASEYLAALVTIFGPFIPPGTVADLLDQIDVSHADTTVTISLSATVAQLTAVGKQLGPSITAGMAQGGAEARRAEFHDITVAIIALMIENNLRAIPNPVTANTAPCTRGTQEMTAYPDAASVAGSADKANDPNGAAYTDGIGPAGDKDGYVLFAHDIIGDNSQAALVNYINFDSTTYCYTIDPNGTVHQYLTDGTEQVN